MGCFNEEEFDYDWMHVTCSHLPPVLGFSCLPIPAPAVSKTRDSVFFNGFDRELDKYWMPVI